MYGEYSKNPPESLAEFEAIFKRLRSGERGIYALGAYAGDALIGFAQGSIHPATNLRGDYCYLQDLFVAQAARRRGVARQLVEAVVAHAKQNHAARVYWRSEPNNTAARALYDSVARLSNSAEYRIALL